MNDKQKFIYTYFYDYWVNNKWDNSNSKKLTFPETNPHPATVIQFDFLK